MKESPNHQRVSRREGSKVRKQLDFRMTFGEQLIADFRGIRKGQIPSNIDEEGNFHWPGHFEFTVGCGMCPPGREEGTRSTSDASSAKCTSVVTMTVLKGTTFWNSDSKITVKLKVMNIIQQSGRTCVSSEFITVYFWTK